MLPVLTVMFATGSLLFGAMWFIKYTKDRTSNLTAEKEKLHTDLAGL